MDSTPNTDRSKAFESHTSSSKSFFARTIIRGDDRSSTEPVKGPLNLTTLYKPVNNATAVDLVFVHGLNGGSYSTWSRGGNPAYMWPKEWLPKDEAFQDVRIHTFGYSSGVNRDSILDIQDFAQTLLATIKDAPAIPREEKAPLIFVAHSMGGLVVKKAFILAQEIPEFLPLAARVSAIFFLATPHQGADIAKVLKRILDFTPGTRPFVHDLIPMSPTIQSINDEFPRHSSHLQLFSFYETKSMNRIIGSRLIVEKESAVMNYVNERRMLLNANHRDVARYSSRNDPSYLTVRNALATFIDAQRHSRKQVQQQIDAKNRKFLSVFLRVNDIPEDDYLVHESTRLPGSCEWLVRRPSFCEWKESISRTFWLKGRPGMGKSVISSHVITHLRSLDRDCCFFYFVDGDKTKTSVDSFLRSMAYQMALIHPEVLLTILDHQATWNEAPADMPDHNTIWRRVFLASVLKIRLQKTQYWIIDAIDECKEGTELISFLSRIQEVWPLCIFSTSRHSLQTYSSKYDPNNDVTSDTITETDNEEDITSYVIKNMDSLPAQEIFPKELITKHIVQNAKGSFLWTKLVLQELRQVSTAKDFDKVLHSKPSDMDHFYQRILDNMAGARFGKDLSKAVLIWAICSFRPLTVQEAHLALETDINSQIPDLQLAIETSCGNLIYVDQQNKIQLTHLSVREFITSTSLISEFTVNIADGHRKLALACLRYLCSADMKPPNMRQANIDQSGRRHIANDILQKHPFADYACTYLFQHMLHVKLNDFETVSFLTRFLNSENSLTWIEYLACKRGLQVLFEAGKILGTLLIPERSSPSFHENREMNLLEKWSDDLTHLVTQFGKRLIDCPYAIHQIIPPFCPSTSALRQTFSSYFRGLAVLGLNFTKWDDCLSTINYTVHNQNEALLASNNRPEPPVRPNKPLRVASSAENFAVGTSTGKIMFYDDVTFQQTRILEQEQEPVWCITFSESGQLLATAGAKSITVWDLHTGMEKYRLPLQAMCMDVMFAEDDTVLYAAIKNSELLCWELKDGSLRGEPVNWVRDEEMPPDLQTRSPQAARFCSHMGLLAIVYRGQDLILWDFATERVYDFLEKDTGSRKHKSVKVADGSTWIWDVTFGITIERSLIAAAYSDGDVLVYDLQTGSPTASLTGIYPQVLSSSPDGKTLATGDSRGDIQLFDFETLHLLYHVRFDADLILTKALTFTWDSQRLLELRGTQCRVWGPSVLPRHGGDNEESNRAVVTSGQQEVEYKAMTSPSITAIEVVLSHPFVFCGKDDGSVHIYDVSNEPQSQILFIQSAGYFIMHLQFDAESGILSCCDALHIVTTRQITKASKTDWVISGVLLEYRSMSPVSQLIGSGRHSRLLLSTKDHDTLWRLPSGDENAASIKVIDGSDKSQWVMHAVNPDILIHISGHKATTYHWATLECIASYDLLVSDGLICSLVMPLHNSGFFASITKRLSKATRKIHQYIQIWDFKDFDQNTAVIEPLLDLAWLASSIQEVIGVSHNRLVFLNTDYWVCSIDLKALCLPEQAAERLVFNPASQVVRHFFVPYDWISLVHNLHLDIGSHGEIIFVKKSELAVIKRGLDVTDSGPCNFRRGANSRIDFPSRTRLQPKS